MIRTHWNGEVLQVFERNKNIGYVDGHVLFMFDKNGYAEKFCELNERSEIPDAVRRYKYDTQTPIGISHGDRIIGILIAHLVQYEPDAVCIKDAREYLKNRV